MSKAKNTSKNPRGSKTTSKTARKAPTVRMRAMSIIKDSRYDEDTHNAIRRALKVKDPELGDLVGRAERGDIILDLIGEQEELEKAAALVVQVINDSRAPDWLTNAMMVALCDVAKRSKVPIFKETKGGGEDFDVKELAKLFTITQFFDLEPRVSPTARQRAADALSELLCNEETPAALYNRCAEFVAETRGDEVSKAIYWQPNVIGKLLDYLAAREGTDVIGGVQ